MKWLPTLRQLHSPVYNPHDTVLRILASNSNTSWEYPVVYHTSPGFYSRLAKNILLRILWFVKGGLIGLRWIESYQRQLTCWNKVLKICKTVFLSCSLTYYNFPWRVNAEFWYHTTDCLHVGTRQQRKNVSTWDRRTTTRSHFQVSWRNCLKNWVILRL